MGARALALAALVLVTGALAPSDLRVRSLAVATVFADDFNRPNETPLAAPWVAFEEAANLVSGAVQIPGSVPRGYSDGQSPLPDHAAQALVTRVGFDGVHVRALNGSNWYWGGYDSGSGLWFIRQRVAGADTVLASVAEAAPATVTIKLQVDTGQNLTLLADGVQKLTATGTRADTDGTGGFRSSGSAGATYDDYVLTDSSGAPAATSARHRLLTLGVH